MKADGDLSAAVQAGRDRVGRGETAPSARSLGSDDCPANSEGAIRPHGDGEVIAGREISGLNCDRIILADRGY